MLLLKVILKEQMFINTFLDNFEVTMSALLALRNSPEMPIAHSGRWLAPRSLCPNSGYIALVANRFTYQVWTDIASGWILSLASRGGRKKYIWMKNRGKGEGWRGRGHGQETQGGKKNDTERSMMRPRAFTQSQTDQRSIRDRLTVWKTEQLMDCSF